MSENTAQFIMAKFLTEFSKLKNLVKEDPKKLEIFYNQNQKIKELATQIKLTDDLWLPKLKDNKIQISHPRIFVENYKEYKRVWKPVLDLLFWSDFNLEIEELPISKGSIDDSKSGVTIGSAKKDDCTIISELEKPDPEIEVSFDPTSHHGGDAFEGAFNIVRLYAEEVGLNNDETSSIHNQSKIGLEAYDYLKNNIGFDPQITFRRWQNMEPFFIPKHIANAHGTEKDSLYELLNQAIRAFVFDVPSASMAMCRAVLETLLKKHYRLNYQYKSKGRTLEKGLGELIVLADEKYNFVQKGKLKPLTDNANLIMHKGKINLAEEKTIEEFFKTLKYLIEKAPKL